MSYLYVCLGLGVSVHTKVFEVSLGIYSLVHSNLVVSGLPFTSLVPFWMMWMYGEGQGYSFILCSCISSLARRDRYLTAVWSWDRCQLPVGCVSLVGGGWLSVLFLIHSFTHLLLCLWHIFCYYSFVGFSKVKYCLESLLVNQLIYLFIS